MVLSHEPDRFDSGVELMQNAAIKGQAKMPLPAMIALCLGLALSQPASAQSYDPTSPSSLPLVGDVTGRAGSNTVSLLQHVPVSSTAPTSGQYLGYNGSSWLGQTFPVATAATLGLAEAGSSLTVNAGVLGVANPLPAGTAAGQVAWFNGNAWALLPNVTADSSGDLTTTGALGAASFAENGITAISATVYGVNGSRMSFNNGLPTTSTAPGATPVSSATSITTTYGGWWNCNAPASGTTYAMTLPAAANCTGRNYIFKMGALPSGDSVTVTSTSSFLDPVSALTYSTSYQCRTFSSNGTSWYIVGGYL